MRHIFYVQGLLSYLFCAFFPAICVCALALFGDLFFIWNFYKAPNVLQFNFWSRSGRFPNGNSYSNSIIWGWKSLSISHAVILHNLSRPKHGHVYYHVYMCPPICPSQVRVRAQDEDHIRWSQLLILSWLSWRHANCTRADKHCKLACNCGEPKNN